MMSKETAAEVNVRRTFTLSVPIIIAAIAAFVFFLSQGIAGHHVDLVIASVLVLVPAASMTFTLARLVWLRSQY